MPDSQLQLPATPPVVAKRPHEVSAPFGAVRQDPYYWLRDDTPQATRRCWPSLIAENAYADAVLASGKPLQERLFAEITGAHQAGRRLGALRERGYWYYRRFETGKDYAVYARRKGSMEPPRRCCSTRTRWPRARSSSRSAAAEVSQDNRLLAWAEDTVGRRQYMLRVKDIATGRLLDDACRTSRRPGLGRRPPHASTTSRRTRSRCCPSASRRMCSARRPSSDRLVYEEPDDSFYLGIGAHALGQVLVHHFRQHGQHRVALSRRWLIRACSPCSRRGSATSNTRPTTSATAG